MYSQGLRKSTWMPLGITILPIISYFLFCHPTVSCCCFAVDKFNQHQRARKPEDAILGGHLWGHSAEKERDWNWGGTLVTNRFKKPVM